MDDDDNDNVFQFGVIQGDKEDIKINLVAEEPSIPVNDYVITDLDGNEFYESGFMVFTPYHCAIMRDHGQGAVPRLIVPLTRVKAAEILDDEE